MCGIVAVLDFDQRPVARSEIAALRDTMVHRGPDDEGLFVEGPVGLGFRRLSIIDLTSAGHQPMTNEDGSLQLVFNGEIYNYLELREDLVRRGHRFRSGTDSEVILHQYEEDGERCLEKFRGMFGFALWDRRRQRLFAARDRFGIKPLYYCRAGNRLIVASEIKAIVEDPAVRRVADPLSIADYLYAGRALGSRTMFQGIASLEPGHRLVADLRERSVAVDQYWRLHYNYNFTRTPAQTLEELTSIVEDAVAIHCRSDAPLGCHLSGGLDSSAVVGLAARHREHLQTFSTKFSDDPYIDESRYAKAVASHVGAEYLQCSPDAGHMADVLPFLVWHMDEPMTSDGGFGYFTVSELARRYVKVSLTGHGGDEVFAGYPAQFQAAFNTTEMFRLSLDPDRVLPAQGLFRRVAGKGPAGLYRALRARTRRRKTSLADLWAALHCNGLPVDQPFLESGFLRQLGGYSPHEAYSQPFRSAETDQTLDQCLYHDLTVYLPSLLQLEDRFSMAVSLESRVPLLDHRIVEFLATVPPEQKVAGLVPKHLLRGVASSVLPAEICKRNDKRGFPVPGRFQKTGRMAALIREVLLSSSCRERGVLNAKAFEEACAKPEGNTDFWQFLNLELWFKLYIDRDPAYLERVRNRAATLANV